MKIYFACDSLMFGGSEKMICNLANYLIKSNDVCIVLTSSLHEKPFFKLDKRIVVEELIDKKPIKSKIKKCFLLRRLWKKDKPDVVIAFHPHVVIYTFLSLIGLSVPTIFSERNDPREERLPRFFRWLKKRAFYYSNLCVFQTKDAFDFYSWVPKKKKTIIYNPVSSNNTFKRNNDNIDKTVVFAGRLVEQKNVALLITSFSSFLKSHPSYRLNIYGDGPLLSSLKSKSNQLGISKSIFFQGAVSDWLFAERNAKMFVLPSNFEGMPNSLIEAMSIGIPSISTDCPIGGPKEIISNGINGFLVPTSSEVDLVKAMCLLADNEEISQNISKEAILTIEKKFDELRIFKQWEDSIIKVVNYGKQ